ncbi:sigma-70 family RNA polymerase sigma factor [Lentzea sp. NPDC003310]|uniref:RNA polymerase sigma factor n=1 Tax=Lentzea sp. NPDC003310 TaxID=3154447 RepID=UPI0033B9D56C
MTDVQDDPPEQRECEVDSQEILRDAYRLILAFFRRRVPTKAIAYELSHDTFVRLVVWRSRNNCRLPDDLMGFLYRHAEWVRCDYFKKLAKIGEAEALTGDCMDLAALANGKLLASVTLPEALIDVASTVDLERAVAALPERTRLALVLRFVDDLPTPRIANVLGISPQAVNEKIRKGVAELSESQHLAGYAPRGGHR